MHGVKKTVKSDAEKALQAQKAATYLQLVQLVLAKRLNREFTVESLNLTAKMIKANPDFYSLWNFRREILIHLYGEELGLNNTIGEQKIKAGQVGAEVRDQELEMSAEGIKKNSKSYGAWYHRKWIVNRFEVDRESELALCDQFLMLDQRNFHCWAYRRYVSAVTLPVSDVAIAAGEDGGVDSNANGMVKQEFDFSSKKLADNPSNYSAFHHRSIYIQELVKQSSLPTALTDTISSEIGTIDEPQLVVNAIFTEPHDQSAWWYLHFLIKWAESSLVTASSNTQWFIQMIHNMISIVKLLHEEEPKCKWVHSCFVYLIDSLRKVDVTSISSDLGFEPVERLLELRHSSLETLKEIDPMHRYRYDYLLSN